MSHFANVCVHGRVYGQCRCPSRDKEQRLVECRDDRWHRDRIGYTPKHARSELDPET